MGNFVNKLESEIERLRARVTELESEFNRYDSEIEEAINDIVADAPEWVCERLEELRIEKK